MKQKKKLGRRILFVVSGLLLVLTITFAGVLLLLNDDDYRDIIIWSVDTFTDSQLEVNGAFSISFGEEVVLSAEEVHLKADDNSYGLLIGKLNAQHRFGSYLKTGVFWFNDLTLADVRLNIIETESGQQDDQDDDEEYWWDGFSFPQVRIEKAQLNNLSLVYTETDQQQHTIKLSHLVIDDDDKQSAVKVNGGGEVKARAFTIEGTLGSLSQLRDTAQPYPIDLALFSNTLKSSLTGKIDGSVSDNVFELQLQISDPEFSQTLGMLYKDVPALGRLKLTASLRGDYDTPRLESIDISLQRKANFEMKLQGEIGNLAEMDKARFDVSLSAPDLEQLAILLDTELPALGPVNVSAKITGNADKQLFDGVQLSIGSPDKPDIKASGTVHTKLPESGRVEAKFDVATTMLIKTFMENAKADDPGRLHGSISVSGQNGKWAIEKINLVSADTSLYQLQADGAYDARKKRAHGSFETNLAVPDLKAFGALFGIDLAGFAPYKTKGVFAVSENQLSYQGKTRIGKTESDTEMTATLVGDKPFVKGKLTIPVLHLSDFGLKKKLNIQVDDSAEDKGDTSDPSKVDEDFWDEDEDEVEQRKSEKTKPSVEEKVKTSTDEVQFVFDREPLNIEDWQHFNLDFAVLVDQIEGVNYSIDKLDGQIKLTDGVLSVSPFRLTFEGGETDLDLEVDTRNTPSVSLKVTADKLVLGKIIAEVQQAVPVEGNARIHVDISGHGKSAHELASSLSGEVSFGLENARLPREWVELLSVDVLGWALRTTTRSDSYARIDCVMVGFDVEQGVAESNMMVADGPTLLIKGRTTLDLGKETIDMVLLPEQKQSVYSNMSPVNIKGPLMDPDVKAMSNKAAATNIGVLVVAPYVAISNFLVHEVWKEVGSDNNKSDGCAKFIAEQKAK